MQHFAPDELDLVGWRIVNTWRGKIGEDMVTGLVVALDIQLRIIYYDQRARGLRSIPLR